MSRDLTFDFPLPENLGNARLHWGSKRKLQARFLELCDNRVLARVNPKAPTQPFAKADAFVEVRTYRRADPDNAVARTKWIWDWFRTRGYLVDDSRDHVRPTTTLRTVPRAYVGVTVRLVEVP